MSSQTKPDMGVGQSTDVIPKADSLAGFNFEAWAGAVKQQMIAALRKRDGSRDAN